MLISATGRIARGFAAGTGQRRDAFSAIHVLEVSLTPSQRPQEPAQGDFCENVAVQGSRCTARER